MGFPQSIADAIANWIPAMGDMRATFLKQRDALEQLQKKHPELTLVLQPLIADADAKLLILEMPVDMTTAAALGIAVLREFADLPRTGLNPKFHPGSGTGG